MLNRKSVITLYVLIGLILFLKPATASSLTAREQFFKAETCYKNLRHNPVKMKYRENWLGCVEAFESAYREDANGPWAAAALFKTGELYQELYRYSFKTSDIKEALDIFERVSKRFPRSSYKPKAEAKIREIDRAGPKPAPLQPKAETGKQFAGAESCYDNLRRNPAKMKYRENWLRCIDAFEAAYKENPNAPRAAAVLFRIGELYQELYKRSFRSSDKAEAVDIFQRVIKQFPDSEYKVLAEQNLGKTPAKGDTPVLGNTVETASVPPAAPKDDIAAVIEKLKETTNAGTDIIAPSEDGKATVTNLRFWSNPNYTRIVIDADTESTYTHRLLNEDPSIQKPQRLYIDLDNSKLGKDTSKVVPINDNLLSDARAGQYTLDTVRVVVDIKSFKTYKIFSLKNPFRIVVDIWGEGEPAAVAEKGPAQTAVKDQKIPVSALAKQLALGVRRIVIDPGHGGRDYGAPGYLRGVHEKHVVLDIAKKLAEKIRKELGCEVVMTRTGDHDLTLEERTAIANTENADLFISIHTNSVRDRRAYGIETYFLNLATDDEAIRVAAMENATSTKNISDLQTILNDLMHNAKVNESSRLAVHVQEALYSHMKTNYSSIKNKGVKQAPFYVLLGAQMPSILIETSFISNSRECKRLTDPKYQDHLIDAIVKGIRIYIKETNPTAYGDPSGTRKARG
ncbi:MAG: N-acetylmuramoyl-L-alanine amidase [Desulfobacterales bacterium]|nr:N-acetylmuramoyl-L-alanine amidase [Desulfobacterales bacterium]